MTEIAESIQLKPGEKEIFTAVFCPILGIGLCKNEAEAREFGHIPEGMEFRVFQTGPKTVAVLVRPADLKKHESQQKALQKKEKQPAWLHLVRILTVVLGGLLVGGCWTGIVWLVNTIFGTQGNLSTAFTWGFIIGGIIATVSVIIQYFSEK